MIQVERTQMKQIAALFDGIEDSMVIACLQGYMGNAYVKTMNQPKAALIVSGEYSFFGGEPNSDEALYLVNNLFSAIESDTTIAIFSEGCPDWGKRLLSVSENNPIAVPRYGIAQRDYVFDEQVLERYLNSLPAGFTLTPFDNNLYQQAMAETWSQEFCETFKDAEDYLTRGFGFAATKNGNLVSGASTMTVYDGGIEVQVATRPGYEKKGLAYACSAALIKECVSRKVRPCWDAANQISLHMALKLGYEYKGEYLTIHMSRRSNL